MKIRFGKKAFTLIELLIVVAIIAILAAIAVPNFLEAQTRSKVSRVKADIRSAATALESYAVDWNAYPYDGYNRINTAKYNYWFLSDHISTPIAYMTTNIIVDPFRQHLPATGAHYQLDNVRYRNIEATWGIKFDGMETGSPAISSFYNDVLEEYGGWALNGAGPDQTYGPTAWPGVSAYPANPIPYDPTNGTVSDGDIIRTQKSPTGYVNAPS